MKRVDIGCIVAFGSRPGRRSGCGVRRRDQRQRRPNPGGAQGHSACAFSGQDLPDAEENQPPEFDDDFVTDGHVQSYGKYVSHGLKGVVPSPGDACRGQRRIRRVAIAARDTRVGSGVQRRGPSFPAHA